MGLVQPGTSRGTLRQVIEFLGAKTVAPAAAIAPAQAPPIAKAPADKSSSSPIVAKTPSVAVKNIETADVPEISDCSSAFKAAVQVTYWGHGKIKLSWYLDQTLV